MHDTHTQHVCATKHVFAQPQKARGADPYVDLYAQ